MFEDQTSIDTGILISPCLIDAMTLRLLSCFLFVCFFYLFVKIILEMLYFATVRDVYTKLDHKLVSNIFPTYDIQCPGSPGPMPITTDA